MSNTIHINIHRSDIGFLIEAIELRSKAMIDAILDQALEQSKPKEPQKTSWTVTATDNGSLVAVNKKRTAKKRGRRKGTKMPPIVRTAETPWGYKKDGTPKKRPGRGSVSPAPINPEVTA
jgi:hypothetical protein